MPDERMPEDETQEDAIDPADSLLEDFEAMCALMQTPRAAMGVDAFFEMGGEALGRAAARGARRRAALARKEKPVEGAPDESTADPASSEPE